MADRLDMDAFVGVLLDHAPDAARDAAAVELAAIVASHLTLLVGPREAAAHLYAIADLAATQQLVGEKGGG